MYTATILTMHPDAFSRACEQLQMLCMGRGEPDLVVGIVRGGQYVAERMFASVPHARITLQRHATRYKSAGIAHWLLRHLPYAVLDRMRKAEAMHREKHAPRYVSEVVLDTDTALAIAHARRVLIVDDSVDTGSIMMSVRNAVERCAAPGTDIVTAAITVTTARPMICPNYALYRDRTLIRFPWSNDYKPCAN